MTSIKITANNIQPRLFINDNNLCLEWTCPRCNFRQLITLPIDDNLLNYNEVRCLNKEICGDRGAYFDLSINISGWYKSCEHELD